MLVLYIFMLVLAAVPIVLYLIALFGWFVGMPIVTVETSAWMVNSHMPWLIWSPILFAVSLLLTLITKAGQIRKLLKRGLMFLLIYSVSCGLLFATDVLFQKSYVAIADIRVVNDSPMEISTLRIFGAGVDQELGPLASGDSLRFAFFPPHSGELKYEVKIGERVDGGTIADMITPEKGCREHITFDSTGSATIVWFGQMW